jgi:CoA:oxalate CoA-transferase
VNLAVGSPGLWERFCKCLGLEELLTDERFVDNPARVSNRAALNAVLRPRIQEESTAAMLALLEEAGVPCGPVATMDQILEDEHTHAIDMVVEVPHQELGTVKVMGTPLSFSATPGAVEVGPPVLDQHGAALRDEFSS